MDKIPTDIWRTAKNIVDGTEYDDWDEDSVKEIARAILAERKRCADAVHRVARDFYGNTDQMQAAALIASSIEAAA